MIWIAAAVGTALGVVVGVIARIVARRLQGGEFWSALPDLTRDLVSHSDGDAFLKAYGRLIRLLGSYLFRNAIQLVASFAPVVVTVLLFGSTVTEYYNRRANELTIHPPRQLSIESRGNLYSTNSAGTAIAPVPDFEGTAVATTDRGRFEVGSLWRNRAWCAGSWRALGMGLLGFETQAADDATEYLVLRPRCGDFNPLWPYLNDLEFFFYLGIAAASGITAPLLKSRGR